MYFRYSVAVFVASFVRFGVTERCSDSDVNDYLQYTSAMSSAVISCMGPPTSPSLSTCIQNLPTVSDDCKTCLKKCGCDAPGAGCADGGNAVLCSICLEEFALTCYPGYTASTTTSDSTTDTTTAEETTTAEDTSTAEDTTTAEDTMTCEGAEFQGFEWIVAGATYTASDVDLVWTELLRCLEDKNWGSNCVQATAIAFPRLEGGTNCRECIVSYITNIANNGYYDLCVDGSGTCTRGLIEACDIQDATTTTSDDISGSQTSTLVMALVAGAAVVMTN
jgi:hypothetical protein